MPVHIKIKCVVILVFCDWRLLRARHFSVTEILEFDLLILSYLYAFVFQRLKPTNPAAQKALTTPTHYKLTPRPATRVRPKALQTTGTAKSHLFDGLDDDEPSLANGAFMPK